MLAPAKTRRLPRLRVALRVLALLVGVQVSGVANVAEDLLAAAGLLTAHADDCAGDDDDAECPPGCPQCHCLHCAMSSLPAFAGSTLHAPEAQRSAFRLVSNDAPGEPGLPSVYRPPRPDLRLSPAV